MNLNFEIDYINIMKKTYKILYCHLEKFNDNLNHEEYGFQCHFINRINLIILFSIFINI